MRLPALTPRFAVVGDAHTDEHTEGRVLSAFTLPGAERAAGRLCNAGFQTVTVEARGLTERVRLLPASARKDLRTRRQREVTA